MKNVSDNDDRLQSRIAIIILNWNGWKDTVELLSSLFRIDHTFGYCYIVIIDNGSEDDSVNRILEWCVINSIRPIVIREENAKIYGSFENSNDDVESKIFIILNNKNYGYACGMNIGISFAKCYLNSDFVVLLNNDTVVDKNSVKEMYNVFIYSRYREKIGIVGPMVTNYYSNEPILVEQYLLPMPLGSILSKFFKNIAVHKEHYSLGSPLIVNRLDGSCFMVKINLFNEIGSFNEDFFAYWEDTDLFTRARNKKYRIVLTQKSIIKHKIGAVNTSLKKINLHAIYYFGRNAIHFINLHYKGIFRIIVMIAFIISSAYLFLMYSFFFRNIKAAIFFSIGVIKGFLGERGESKTLKILINKFNK